MTTKRKLLDDCFLTDKERLTYDQATTILSERVGPVCEVETSYIHDALGRVTAQDVVAPRPIPAFDNAAVDGYAFAHSQYVANDGTLQVTDRVAAGHPSQTPLISQTAARIFTGAVMPQGADSVAMQEDCELSADGSSVMIPPGLKAGANCRLAGEDQSQGQIVVPKGAQLRPQDLAAIASTGADQLLVYKRLRVAVISTGDEITAPGADLPAGGVYDSNTALLLGLIKATGAQADHLGTLPDRADQIEQALKKAATQYDLILTTGGASRGEEDHLVDIMDRIGTRHLWQLAIKPGRPMMFGQIEDTVVLSLPGNPVAVFVCFLLFGHPLIGALSGRGFKTPTRFPLPAAFEIAKKKPDRREFLRGRVTRDEHGRPTVAKFNRDGSGLISSLTASDGLIEIEEAATSVKPGETVCFIPFSQFGF